jgi:hypothetical protein
MPLDFETIVRALLRASTAATRTRESSGEAEARKNVAKRGATEKR